MGKAVHGLTEALHSVGKPLREQEHVLEKMGKSAQLDFLSADNNHIVQLLIASLSDIAYLR